MKRVKLQPAFILHSRPYGDTSLLVDLLTLNYGRVRTLARNARGVRSRFKDALQPFTPMLMSWSGNTELMHLATAEATGMSYNLANEALLSGFYLNELIMRLLHSHDAHPEIYCAYEQALIRLQNQQPVARTLRLFEKNLLAALGYGLQLNQEAMTGLPIDPAVNYQFNPNIGFIKNTLSSYENALIFSGEHLLAFAADHLDDEAVLATAKRLMRVALGTLLGDKPIKSRELFHANF